MKTSTASKNWLRILLRVLSFTKNVVVWVIWVAQLCVLVVAIVINDILEHERSESMANSDYCVTRAAHDSIRGGHARNRVFPSSSSPPVYVRHNQYFISSQNRVGNSSRSRTITIILSSLQVYNNTIMGRWMSRRWRTL